jgi:hypothetical protein
VTNEDWRETTFARDATIKAMNERIRELEAELATEHDHCDRFTKERAEWKARAEKAERLWETQTQLAIERAVEIGHLLARVAELEERFAEENFAAALKGRESKGEDGEE